MGHYEVVMSRDLASLSGVISKRRESSMSFAVALKIHEIFTRIGQASAMRSS